MGTIKQAFPLTSSWSCYLQDSLLALSGPSLVTAGIFFLHLYPGIPNISLAYLPVILLLAWIRSRYAAICASFVAVLSFDFFLIPPLYTLVVNDPGQWIVLSVFLLEAILISLLASSLRLRTRLAAQCQQEPPISYALMQPTRREEPPERLLQVISQTIKSASALLQEEINGPEEIQRNSAHFIEHQADQMNRLVTNLLALSRIEEGVLKLEKDWYMLEELIQDALERMQFFLSDRVIQTHFAENLPPVYLDAVLIDQVLTNLLENAIRYTPAHSPIEISVEQKDALILISIADHGPGVAQADLERIFDKFYRAFDPSCKSPVEEGSGLGLAVCRGIVGAHHGKIWAQQRNDSNDRGMTFSLALPLEGDVYE